ncbi:MAG: ZIP family metal transporter [Acidobacteriaceae bacterium]|nr:ZIP family metal transporter [Acidobacteriaceae bacterium]
MKAALTNLVFILASLFLVAAIGITIGVRLAGMGELSNRIVPFSGGALAGIAAFWVLPELADHEGWPIAALGMMGGFALLWAVDRFLYPVCPSCSHNHDHGSCVQRLHGFAGPLLIAGATHSFFDGWSLAIAQEQPSAELRLVFLVGVAVHKFPEGLAMGVLLDAALGSSWKAALGALSTQTGMFAGALTAAVLASGLTPRGSEVLLAMAAGVFLYLAYHAIEGSLRQRGWISACMPAITGAATAAMMRLVPGL